MHQSNEKRQESRQEHLSPYAAKCAALGLVVIFLENANVDFNYFNILSCFDFTERNMLPTGSKMDGGCVIWNSAGPPNGRHDLGIVKDWGELPQSQTHAVWCNLTMIGLELSFREV